MDKVYLISHGEYSSYTVDLVTLDKEKALEICKKLNESSKYYDNFDVEERIIIDSYEQIEKFKLWRAFVRIYKNGTMGTDWFSREEDLSTLGQQLVMAVTYGNDIIDLSIWHQDKDTALKTRSEYAAEIANEFIQNVPTNTIVENFNKRWKERDGSS